MLNVRGISRSFGDHKVLDEVSFDVRPGRMTGFLGANGSGKTTTMRIVLGVLAAHGGSVSWQGQVITPQNRPHFGYMPEERGLYPKMKVREQITWLGRLHGVERTVAQRNTDQLLEDLELTGRANDRLEQLSLGNQQRVQIAAALVHDPEVLILDEPFSGLDPIAVETVLDVLRKRAASGVPVLFSSHQLAIVERLCDDVVIISKGRIAAKGSREELRQAHASERYEIVVAEDAGWIRDLPGTTLVELDGPRAVFESAPQQVLKAALDRGEVRSFTPVVPTLDEIFKEVI
ncbi:ABC transporter ATP-binding protein [Lentzea kentuckyensis]|uniref:ABC transporter ATP-binding protein n=1 Tax=Lentzea kentuckyensis TaxID=360086 RepID=UPI000A3CF31F|nr:ATP-binding cassette domain-containing protein [Lentzea kentuckyensis]